jgi:hypothetical protein
VQRGITVRETAAAHWSPEVLGVANRLSELRTIAGVSG